MPPSAAPPEEAARAAQEPLAAPIGLAGPKPRPSAWLRLAALVAALAGHAAVLYVLMREPPDLTAGGRGQLLDAVNVTLVDSAAIEARKVDRAQAPVPAAGDVVSAQDGAPKQPEEKKATQEQRQPKEPVPAEADFKELPRVQDKDRTEASVAKAVGGVATRGEVATAVQQIAPAAASPGAVREYANSVQRALARAKPKCARRFTVRIKLLVSQDGGIESVEILKSSGKKSLDATVLAEVQRIKLPTPPPGLAFEERWYEFPVRCR